MPPESSADKMPATKGVFCSKFSPARQDKEDYLAVEEPLELRVNGAAVSVLMRTPGHDEDLIYGFLATEGIISSASDVLRVSQLDEFGENRIVAFLKDNVRCDLAQLTRHVFTASSCGLCGKATIESVMQMQDTELLENQVLSETVLLQSVQTMQEAQFVFTKTGGLHAAGLFSLDGKLLVLREDVGRHNAVDKVIGFALKQGLDLKKSFLLVSGRVSFEILQKSLAVEIPCVAAISAPSSLAVEFAVKSGQTLIGFLRPPMWNLYYEGAVKLKLKQ